MNNPRVTGDGRRATEQESLKGIVQRVTFFNAENGFAVLRVEVKGKRDLVSVVGNVTSVSVGEELEAEGRWVIDRQHGPQFKAEKMTTTHPASARGIEKYLASGAIRSIGPKLAEKIVSLYQERTLEVLEETPDFLLQVRGIGKGRLQRIRQSWREQREVRKITLFLAEHDITASRAVRIYRAYGQEAIAIIKNNPYQLADDIRGIGFKTADALAATMGIDRNHPHRARAGVRYTLQDLATQGHCGYPEEGVLHHAVALLGIDAAIIETAVAAILTAGDIVREQVDGEPWLYLSSLYHAEQGLADAVHRIATSGPHPMPTIDVARALEWVEDRLEIDLAAAQREAIEKACREKFLVITGGPGVGKTTLVRSILEIFSAKGLDCVLAAPTGRAAKRLAESSGRPAATIHRLLEYDPVSGEFTKTDGDPLAGDLFVFDETSMVDVVLGFQVLRAIPPHAAVIMVGDVDQLPSVGPGSVLKDLIDSGIIPLVRLVEIFRQAEQSRITLSANAINHGSVPELPSSETLTDFYFVEAGTPEAVSKMIVRLVRERIPDRFRCDPLADIQVLTPMNRSVLGARVLNAVLQEALNPPADNAPDVERFGWVFRVGDRVIQTENNYDRDVFNGDLGIIQKVNRIEQSVAIEFEGRSVEYDFGDLDELALAYALTIHKSQGSEFPCVVIPLHTQHYVMLQRNLLYTAVTRAKRLAVIVGTKKALHMAIQRIDTRERRSALVQRLRSQASRE